MFYREERYSGINRWAAELECCGREITKQLAEENTANSKYFSRNEVYRMQQVRWRDWRQQQLRPQVENLTSQRRKVF